ncbi:ATP-dependent DNA ligase [compost metagenome]
MVSIEEFETGNFVTPYWKRLEMLESIRDLIEASASLSLTPYEVYTGQNKEAEEFITAKHNEYVIEGYEGLMVKDLDAVYKLDKGRAIQKVKKFFTLDLTVVGVEEGKEGTQIEGTLGALIVELSDKDILEQLPEGQPYVKGGTFLVNVGSGFKILAHHEYNRDVLWGRKGDLINRTIEIKCFGSTLNDDGGHSLRFPIFKRFRDDK